MYICKWNHFAIHKKLTQHCKSTISVRAKSLQSCLTPCDPIDGSHQAPPSLGFSRQEHWSGLTLPSPVHESEKWKRSCSVVSDSVTPWTVAHQAPLSVGFSRQESWSGLLCPSLLSFPTLILFIICTFIYCLSPTSNVRILRAKDLFCLLFPPLHLSETVRHLGAVQEIFDESLSCKKVQKFYKIIS